MIEVKISNKDLGVKIFANGIPKLGKIPLDIMQIFISTIEKDIASNIDKKNKKKNSLF